MSSTTDILSRLRDATSYAELQEVFVQLAARAESESFDPQFADVMDEAIQRLNLERTRDEQELKELQAQYESFRDRHRGFVGWIKRHAPFTETRRKEREHQGELADQAAEILADNLVIARAQMIKERLLPPERRRLGQRVAEWQARWDNCGARPQGAAECLRGLHAELVQSRAFVAELKQDIEAFAEARFRESADRQRRDADLAAARRELAALDDEMKAEESLKQRGLRSVAEQVARELSATHAEFRRDSQQLVKLFDSAARLNESRDEVAKLAAAVKQTAELNQQLQAWPEKMNQAREAVRRIDSERASAAQALAAKTAIVDERQQRLAEAQRSAGHAAQMLKSLQAAYDEHKALRAAAKSMPIAAEEEPAAPIVAQYETARAGAELAEAQLRDIKSALDAARREVSRAETAVQGAEGKITGEQKKLREVEADQPRLRAELASLIDRGQGEFARAAAALAAYLYTDRSHTSLPPYRPEEIAAGTIGWLGPAGMDRAFSVALLQSNQDRLRSSQAATVLERLHQWLEAQQQSMEREQSQLKARRESVWKRACSECLGDSLGSEACSSGLPISPA
jgi:chromosome segregation ATPase